MREFSIITDNEIINTYDLNKVWVSWDFIWGGYYLRYSDSEENNGTIYYTASKNLCYKCFFDFKRRILSCYEEGKQCVRI